MRILLADDDPVALTLIKAFVEKQGFEPIAVTNGTDAYEKLKETDGPSLAILDLQMPGVDGIDVIKKVKATRTDYVYCILLTVKDAVDTAALSYEAGADDFLNKPADFMLLQQKLKVAKRIIEYEKKQREYADKMLDYAEAMKKLADERARQVITSERRATLGSLAAGIAHEINNPCTFISGNAQSMLRFWDEILVCLKSSSTAQSSNIDFVVQEFPDMIKGILTGTQRISAIVQQLADYSRKDLTLKREQFVLKQAIDDALNLCHNKLKYKFTTNVSVPESIAPLYADRRLIMQVLVNVFVNSVEAMTKDEPGQLGISCLQEDNWLKFMISDNGAGISSRIIEKIFDPFFTTKKNDGNPGLGLSVCKGIIEEHGGQINAYSTEGQGTEIVFTIPVSEPY